MRRQALRLRLYRWATIVFLVHGPMASTLTQAEGTEQLLSTLQRQGVMDADIRGVDANGIPIVCSDPAGDVQAATLPTDTWGWECIPSVIRDDGIESFRLEVEVSPSTPVSSISVNMNNTKLSGPSGSLRDDGVAPDIAAGDHIYTAGPWTVSPSFVMPSQYLHNVSSGAMGDLTVESLGIVTLTNTDASTETFLIIPKILILSTNVPVVPSIELSDHVVVTPHLANVKSDNRHAQRFLHGTGGSDMSIVTKRLYQVLPDRFDFLNFFSIDHVEHMPRVTAGNFNAGVHWDIQVQHTGTGQGVFDNSANFGSAGRLKAINFMDTCDRGIYSENLVHEVLHHWSYYGNASLGLGTGAHYEPNSSVGSLLGGFQWIDSGNSNFTRNCAEGANGATYAAPLDKYFMGLIAATQTPPHYVENTTRPPLFNCDALTNSFSTVTIDDITAIHGVRTPTPSTAQRNFILGFAAESFNRFLNATELSCYDRLAAHAVSPSPSGGSDPYVGANWVPIEKYFGENTTWICGIGSLIAIATTNGNSVTLDLSNVAHRGDYYVQETYSLTQPSWTNCAGPIIPPTNYVDQIVVTNATHLRYYRVAQ